MHLHDKGFVLVFALFGFSTIDEHENGGNDVAERSEDGKSVTPTGIVVIGIQ